MGEILTDLQILGCELHKKCVWRPVSTWTNWGTTYHPDHLAVVRGREMGGREGEGKGWK